jgi:hypothetical protein
MVSKNSIEQLPKGIYRRTKKDGTVVYDAVVKLPR